MLHIQYAILAEHYREGLNGKFDLLGPFDRVHAQSVPAQHQQMVFIILAVSDSEDDLGTHEFRLTCTRPNGQLMLEQKGQFRVTPNAGTWLGSARLNFILNGIPLPDHGKYWLTFEIDGQRAATHPFSVLPPPKS
jgi:hypothetical protein